MSKGARTAWITDYSYQYEAPVARTRNLGAAILLAAIEDYRGGDDEAHADAGRFLYPRTDLAQKHYDWAVALNEEVNAAWLREELDRRRPEWDAERPEVELKPRRRWDGKQMGLGGRGLQDRLTGGGSAVVRPAGATCAAGIDETAAGI